MTVFEAIKGRRSIRKYAGGKIERETLVQILEAAMHAPSACNGRPWEFVVVEDRDKLNALAASHPHAQMLGTASAAIIVCARAQEEGTIPAKFWQQDCAAATQNILLAAYGLALGTCWCGVSPNQEIAEAVRAVIGVQSTPFNLIAVGLADENPPVRGKYEGERVKWL